MADHEHLWLGVSTDGIEQCQYCPAERVDPRLAARIEELKRALTKELAINYHRLGCGYGPDHQTSGCIERFVPDAERYVQRVYGAEKEGE